MILKSKYFILASLLFLSCTSYNISDQTPGPISIKEIEGISKNKGPEQPAKDAFINNSTSAPGLESRVLEFNQNPSILEEPLITLASNNNTSQMDSLGITLNNQVAEYLLQFHLNQRYTFTKWLERSGRYLPLMKEILGKYGIPEELVYLALIESGFNTTAVSPAKASGPWQLIPETGLRYGLKINSWVDERRDPLKSTEAAAKYLRDLYTLFGCWVLTVASYNAGEGTVLSAIEKGDSWDFWTLAKNKHLPPQTREFVPKFMAATIIGKEYEGFGFKDIKFLPPLKFEYVKVKGGTPLELISEYSGISYLEIKRLNPELKKEITPPNLNTYKLKVPPRLKASFLKNWSKWEARSLTIKKETQSYYRVKKGDTLWSLSRKYNISLKDLKILNGLRDPSCLQLNQILIIPRNQET